MEEQIDQFRPYSFYQIDLNFKLKVPYWIDGKEVHTLVACCLQTKLCDIVPVLNRLSETLLPARAAENWYPWYPGYQTNGDIDW